MPPITPHPSPAHVVRQRFIAQTETNLWRSLSVPHQNPSLERWSPVRRHTSTSGSGHQASKYSIISQRRMLRGSRILPSCHKYSCKVAYFQSLNPCFVLCSKPLLCVQHNKQQERLQLGADVDNRPAQLQLLLLRLANLISRIISRP